MPLAAIELASPWMLLWLAAAALPWLINLWSRRRHVETSWAAVELLLAAVRERSRRLRLRELLLLALRTSILLLVALAAARPVWRQSAAAAGSQAERTHHVIALDQSFSMATRRDASRLERGQAAARGIVENARSGDAFTVIGWSETADNVLGRHTFDAATALAAIDSLEAADVAADLDIARRAAAEAIAAAEDEFPEVAHTRTSFISDLALNTWSAALQRDDASGAESPPVPGSQVISVEDGIRSNIAITDVFTEPSAPVVDRPLVVGVRLKSFNMEAPGSVSVELLLNGERLGRQEAALPASGIATVYFETRLVETGNHVFEARLVADVDALAVDNRRFLSTVATTGPRVLCVADVEATAEDVARALNPRFRQAPSDGPIAVEIKATAALGHADLPTYDAVFICNARALLPREQRLLRRYVAEGGSLAIVLGHRSEPSVYNEWLQAEPSLAPLAIAAEPVAGEWRLDPLDYRHPIVKPFAGRSRAGLLGVRVSKYFPIQVSDSDRVNVALAFSSGDPALVINEHGRGRVAVLATNPALSTPGEPWSTLAVSPSFVPLMRELLDHLTADRRTSQLNAIAGEAVKGLAPVQARHRGVYPVDGKFIAVNVDPAESDLAAVDLADLPHTDASQQASPTTSYSHSPKPLARYLLVAAGALMLIELTTAWLLGRGWA